MREDFENRDNDEIVIDLWEVFGILKRKFKIVLGITAVFLAVAGAYVFFWPKTYESVALIRTNMNNQGYFTARSTVEPVIVKYAEKDDKGKLPRYDKFIKDIKLTQPRNSNFLTVTVNAKDPQLAQDMNKMLVSNAVGKYLDSTVKKFDAQIVVLEQDLRLVETDLAKAENALNNAQGMGEAAYNAMLGRVNAYSNSAIKIKGDLLALKTKREEMKNDIGIIDEPTFDDKPVSPKKARTLAIALVLGLICGSMYVVVKEKM